MPKAKRGTAGQAVDAILVFVGRDLIQFAFTYPLSTLDAGLRTALLSFVFLAVTFFAVLSCCPNREQKDRFCLFEATTLLYVVASAFATYSAYQDDIATRGPHQLEQILTILQTRTSTSLGNYTSLENLAEQTLNNVLESTKYLHVFILNVLCLIAICLLYYITKFVRKHTLDFLGLITCIVSMSQLFTYWYASTQSCVKTAANEARKRLMSPIASESAHDAAKNAERSQNGLGTFVSDVFECAGNFETLQGTTLVLTSLGGVVIFVTFVLVLLRLGVIKKIMNMLCCCCAGSACAQICDTATCSVASSPIGDAVVLVGIVISMMCVGATHFLASAWATQLQKKLTEGKGPAGV
jgi:hypothetical protein